MREREARSRPLAKRLRRRMTHAEAILWAHLRGGRLGGWRFRRQHPIGPYVADFACAPARLVIEVDGATHSTPPEQRRDARRSNYIRSRGYDELRVWNTDIYENLEGVLRVISDALPPSGPSDHLPRKRGRNADADIRVETGRLP
ncbi:hypothetical protein DDZ18_04680 [Marinicauda salina]|uniref:DUF559 domain-containing protein n=1 Tax=Marinicauda salina TaxID=2135793 RepID=A0A2U2BY12_9PROT|nr:endonuclease domain-containing protein [Marinicauda salina]PWE18890.1 hypothetical protein DDZ18_04680 [Marinicauda salina]